jgi:hypothetical protein
MALMRGMGIKNGESFAVKTKEAISTIWRKGRDAGWVLQR